MSNQSPSELLASMNEKADLLRKSLDEKREKPMVVLDADDLDIIMTAEPFASSLKADMDIEKHGYSTLFLEPEPFTPNSEPGFDIVATITPTEDGMTFVFKAGNDLTFTGADHKVFDAEVIGAFESHCEQNNGSTIVLEADSIKSLFASTKEGMQEELAKLDQRIIIVERLIKNDKVVNDLGKAFDEYVAGVVESKDMQELSGVVEDIKIGRPEVAKSIDLVHKFVSKTGKEPESTQSNDYSGPL